MTSSEIQRRMRERASIIAPDLDLTGCYAQIIPRLTQEQVQAFIDAARADGWHQPYLDWAWELMKLKEPKLSGEQELELAQELFLEGFSASSLLMSRREFGRETADFLIDYIDSSTAAVAVITSSPHIDHRLDLLMSAVSASCEARNIILYAPKHRAIPHMDRLASLITAWFDGRDVILRADDRVEPWLEVIVSNMEKSNFVLASTSRKLLLDRRARQENKHERN